MDNSLENVGLNIYEGENIMGIVNFYHEVDDRLLKFAVIIAQTEGKLSFASTRREVYGKCRRS